MTFNLLLYINEIIIIFMQLKAEFEAFDPQFFEEIEDLKYNYQEAIRKNVEYEEHLRTLSHQYGFPLPEINQEQGSG